MPESVPSHWYNSEYYIPARAPIPSKANYSPENVAWVIEMFAGALHKNPASVHLRYPNNTEYPYTENIESDDITVSHPGDKSYGNEYTSKHKQKSRELMRYERFAKKSAILKMYQNNSPANIEYFNDL